MKNWRRYPEYRDSGVEWLGKIPKHWEVWKLSHAFQTIGSGTTPLSNHPDYYDGDIPWVNTSELRENVITNTNVKLTEKALQDHSVLNLYSPGTLLVAMYGATIGRLGILGITACTNQACCALANSKSLNTKFTFYWLWMRKNELIILSSGGGQPNINQEKIRSIRIPAPPLPEQKSIAHFLDRETSKLDNLIAKKERFIELLQEKRTALISHAVTKGLNPDVPMKDSGVEWLGQIPQHWEVVAVRRLIRDIEQGWSPTANDTMADKDAWGVIKLSAVSKGIFKSQEHKALPENVEPNTRYEIKNNDILLTRANTPDMVGDICVVSDTRPHLMLCDLVYRIRENEQRIERKYFSYWFLSRIGRYQITKDARGSSLSMVKVSQNHIRSWIIELPSREDQQIIVNYLDRETAKIDSLIDKTKTSIEKLKEYRTALISAAVTGKIDVREEVV